MENTNEFRGTEQDLFLFDPIVVVHDVLKHWLTILLIALSVAVGSFILTDMHYEPRYQSQATFVVTTRDNSANVYSNLSSTSSLASVFSELINSSVMRKTVLQGADIPDFNGTISASVVPETNLLNMTVTAPDPRTAFLMAQAIINHHEEVTYQVVDSVSLEVLQGAEVATAPMNRNDAVKTMVKMFLLAGFGTCALLAVLSIMRGTVRSGREARKKLDCTYLGDIPHENKYKTLFAWIRRRKTGILISNPITSFHFVENMRKLTQRIEQHMDSGKVLMVTSVQENEGKSTVAANIALTMVRKGKKVLLIDCDLHKPACATLLETKMPSAGTRDVLLDQTKLSDALTRYKRSSLYLILEKRRYANSGDLLTSQQMYRILDWARREFDFVVLDMPPMSVVSDSEGVADLADASLLVVRQNVVQASVINHAIADLETGKAKLLGCILNNVYSTFLSSGQGYRYGSYGSYGHYHSYSSHTSRK